MVLVATLALSSWSQVQPYSTVALYVLRFTTFPITIHTGAASASTTSTTSSTSHRALHTSAVVGALRLLNTAVLGLAAVAVRNDKGAEGMEPYASYVLLESAYCHNVMLNLFVCCYFRHHGCPSSGSLQPLWQNWYHQY